MKKLTIYSLVLVGLFCWFSPTYAHNQAIVIPLGGTNNSIIGSWWTGTPPTNDDAIVLTFLNDTHYFFGQLGTTDSVGQDGMEHGTYSWNPSSGIFTVSVARDDNGEWGFSHPQGTVTISVNGNTLTMTDNSGTFELTRVTP